MVRFDYDTSYRKGKLICDEPIFSLIRNQFSVHNQEAVWGNKKLVAKGQKPRIPTRKFLIGESGLFDFGMYLEIEKFLIDQQITEIEYTERFNERKSIGFPFVDVSDALTLKMRDYQGEALSNAFTMGCGTIVVGTGGGKSLIQASLLENWKKVNPEFKCVLLVPGITLVNQLVQNFTDYQVSFTFSGWTGDLPLQETQVVITNTENFWNQFGDNRWLTNVDVFLMDECFKGGTNVNTSEGYSEIEKINIGDLVYSKNKDTGSIELKRVTNIWKNLSKSEGSDFIKLTLETGKCIYVTPEHILYTLTGEKMAKDLTINDELISFDD